VLVRSGALRHSKNHIASSTAYVKEGKENNIE
jgi:hypothetical protein